MEEPLMTAALEKTVLYGIFVVAKGADVTAASVTPILVLPFALITSRKHVKDFQSLLMSAMAVKSKVPVRWKKELTLHCMRKGSMRQSVLSHARAYS